MKKPIDSTAHGIIDYVFSGIQLFVPAVLGLNENATRTYQAMGLVFLGMNAVTDTPVGLKKIISLKEHQKADTLFVVALATMTATKMINKDKKTLAFHLAFSSMAVVNYFLTDYDDGK